MTDPLDPAESVEAAPAVELTHVRMKHPDPDARTSAADKGPDATGGFMVPIANIEAAQSHGFVVAHTDEAPADPDTSADEAKAVEEGKAEAEAEMAKLEAEKKAAEEAELAKLLEEEAAAKKKQAEDDNKDEAGKTTRRKPAAS